MKDRMSRFLGAAAVFALLAGTAAAENPSCVGGPDGDLYCADTESATAGSGNPLTILSARGGAQGIIAIGPQNFDLTKLYIFYDGDENDPNPLDGYLGISMKDISKSLLGFVASEQGNFNRAGGNVFVPPPLPSSPTLQDILSALEAQNPPNANTLGATLTATLKALTH